MSKGHEQTKYGDNYMIKKADAYASTPCWIQSSENVSRSPYNRESCRAYQLINTQYG